MVQKGHLLTAKFLVARTKCIAHDPKSEPATVPIPNFSATTLFVGYENKSKDLGAFEV